jgi:hypothetical protein
MMHENPKWPTEHWRLQVSERCENVFDELGGVRAYSKAGVCSRVMPAVVTEMACCLLPDTSASHFDRVLLRPVW